jgi:hypothetical protein
MPAPPADSYVAPPELIRAAFAGAGPDELALLTQQCLEVGAWDHALALAEALPESADSPGVAACRAIASFVAGDQRAALSAIERVLESPRRPLLAVFVRAEMLLRLGEREAAREGLLEVVERYPDYPRALGLLATLYLPGPNYRDVLARLHQLLRPKAYLEIGVDTGATLSLAQASELAVGVDPAELPRTARLPANVKLYREKSEEFFARPRDTVFGSRRVDLVFIDGMHRFENALDDFTHAESWCQASGTIVLHDCVPVVARTAARERSTKFWVGDTWKVVNALAQYRPELKITTILAPPSGLVVVRRLNPAANQLRRERERILERFLPLEYQRAPGDFAPELNAVPNDDAGLALALRP